MIGLSICFSTIEIRLSEFKYSVYCVPFFVSFFFPSLNLGMRSEHVCLSFSIFDILKLQ